MSDVAERDMAWVPAARAGDREALGRGLKAAQGSLLAYARVLLGNRPCRLTAEDLVQEACVRASARFRLFRGSSFAEWRSWLRTILRRCLVDRLPPALGREFGQADASFEDGWEKEGLEPVCPSTTPRAKFEKEETHRRVEEALARLDERARVLIELRVVGGLTFEEIGKLAGKTEDATRMAFERARKRLKALLEQNDVSPP